MRSSLFGASHFGASADVVPRSMGKPAAMYPGAVATDAQLTIAVDRLQTRLAIPLSATDTQMTVIGAGIVANMLLTIDDELVQTVSGSGNVWTITRGRDGTTPAVHLATALVSGFVDAWHHNALVAEIQAIENTLGPNLSKLPISPFVVNVPYNFTPQTPGGNLAVGANSITMNPMPQGLTVGGQLYISGGTGAAEAVPVNGVSAGSIIVTCANAHSGAWTIQSATAGVQEAVGTLVPLGGGTVLVPSGTHNFYGPFVAPAVPCSVMGLGPGSTILVNQNTGIVFTFNNSGINYSICNLTMKPGGGTPRNVYAVRVGANDTFLASGLYMSGFNRFFDIAGPTNQNYFSCCMLSDPYDRAIGWAFDAPDGHLGNTIITSNCLHCGVDHKFLAAVYFAGDTNTSGVWINNNDFFNPDYGLYVCPGANGGVGQLFSTNNAYQHTGIFTIIIEPADSGFVYSTLIVADNMEENMTDCIRVGGSTGTVNAVTISNCSINSNLGVGITIGAGATNTVISDCKVAANGLASPGTRPGISIESGVSRWTISGGVYGPCEGHPAEVNSQSFGIAIQAGPSDNYSITGAYIPPNSTGTLFDGGTGLHKVIANNLGVDTAPIQTIASAATITVPSTASFIYLSGTTTVLTINGGWIGRKITIIAQAAVTIGGPGGNVPLPHAMSASGSLTLTFVDINWF